MSINVDKIECFVVTKIKAIPRLIISLKGNSIKPTKHFRYLGLLISSNERCTNEIKRRIALSRQAFGDLRYNLRNNKMSFKIKFLL